MRPVLFIAVLVLTVAPMGVGQEQSARGSHRISVEETIRKLDNERIQAQIHADAAALDRIYATDFIGVGPSGTVRTKPQVISRPRIFAATVAPMKTASSAVKIDNPPR